MSLVRIHNFAISLDGFGTGEHQTLKAPFGHAGMRLHKWQFATRWGREVFGNPGGSTSIRPHPSPASTEMEGGTTFHFRHRRLARRGARDGAQSG